MLTNSPAHMEKSCMEIKEIKEHETYWNILKHSKTTWSLPGTVALFYTAAYISILHWSYEACLIFVHKALNRFLDESKMRKILKLFNSQNVSSLWTAWSFTLVLIFSAGAQGFISLCWECVAEKWKGDSPSSEVYQEFSLVILLLYPKRLRTDKVDC